MKNYTLKLFALFTLFSFVGFDAYSASNIGGGSNSGGRKRVFLTECEKGLYDIKLNCTVNYGGVEGTRLDFSYFGFPKIPNLDANCGYKFYINGELKSSRERLPLSKRNSLLVFSINDNGLRSYDFAQAVQFNSNGPGIFSNYTVTGTFDKKQISGSCENNL